MQLGWLWQKDAARGGAAEALAELQAAVEAARRDAPAQAAAVEGEPLHGAQ